MIRHWPGFAGRGKQTLRVVVFMVFVDLEMGLIINTLSGYLGWSWHRCEKYIGVQVRRAVARPQGEHDSKRVLLYRVAKNR
jgi:hypothetical protein